MFTVALFLAGKSGNDSNVHPLMNEQNVTQPQWSIIQPHKGMK